MAYLGWGGQKEQLPVGFSFVCFDGDVPIAPGIGPFKTDCDYCLRIEQLPGVGSFFFFFLPRFG